MKQNPVRLRLGALLIWGWGCQGHRGDSSFRPREGPFRGNVAEPVHMDDVRGTKTPRPPNLCTLAEQILKPSRVGAPLWKKSRSPEVPSSSINVLPQDWGEGGGGWARGTVNTPLGWLEEWASGRERDQRIRPPGLMDRREAVEGDNWEQMRHPHHIRFLERAGRTRNCWSWPSQSFLITCEDLSSTNGTKLTSGTAWGAAKRVPGQQEDIPRER